MGYIMLEKYTHTNPLINSMKSLDVVEEKKSLIYHQSIFFSLLHNLRRADFKVVLLLMCLLGTLYSEHIIAVTHSVMVH